MSKRSSTPAQDYSLSDFSRALFPIGAGLPALWETFESAGFEITRLYRNYVRTIAGTPARYANVLEYWEELAKERIGALTGPYDELSGDVPAHAQYRSEFLSGLRIMREKSTPEFQTSLQLEPTIAKAVRMSAADIALQEFRALRKIRAEIEIATHDCVDWTSAARYSSSRQYELVVSLYAEEGARYGFTVERKAGIGCVVSRKLGEYPWKYCLLDQSKPSIAFGGLQFATAVFPKNFKPNPTAPPLGALATIPPDMLIPGLQWYSYYESFRGLHLCVKASIWAAEMVARRVETQLNEWQANQ